MLWFQTYETQQLVESWPELFVAIEQKYGRDLYQNDMKDLLSIRQTSDVLEYANRFDLAKHKVLVHNKDMGEVFFVQKFLDGLKYNISNVISLHRPRIVDVALSLALMQEEIVEASTKRFSPRTRESSRFPSKTVSQPSPSNSPIAGLLGAPPLSEKPV